MTVVAANQEMWRVGSQMKLEIVDINRELRRERYTEVFERNGIYFTTTVGANVGWRLAGRAVAFLGGTRGAGEKYLETEASKVWRRKQGRKRRGEKKQHVYVGFRNVQGVR